MKLSFGAGLQSTGRRQSPSFSMETERDHDKRRNVHRGMKTPASHNVLPRAEKYQTVEEKDEKSKNVVTSAVLFLIRLKVRCRVHLCWRVVALEGTLEGGAATSRADGVGVWLLRTVAQAVVVYHQVVGLLLALLAAPDPPSNETQTGQDNRAANTDNHTDDSGARLGCHAGSSVVVIVVATLEAGWRGRGGNRLRCIHRASGIGSDDGMGDSRPLLR